MKSRKQWPGRVTLGYISSPRRRLYLHDCGLKFARRGHGRQRVRLDVSCSAAAGHASKFRSPGASMNRRSTLPVGCGTFAAPLPTTLLRLQRNKPAVVAIDIALPDSGDPADDEALEKALAATPNLILGSDVLPGGEKWEDPLPAFRRYAKAVGHVHASPDPVNRKIPLEVVAGHDRRWAMALEAYRLRNGVPVIEESLHSLDVGAISIPARRDTSRALYLRYAEGIPRVSVSKLSYPEAQNKVVFVGITAQTAAHDRLMTPFGTMMTGVEIHAQAYETISRGQFLTPASPSAVVAVCLLLIIGAGATFAFLSGWSAYLVAFALLDYRPLDATPGICEEHHFSLSGARMGSVAFHFCCRRMAIFRRTETIAQIGIR